VLEQIAFILRPKVSAKQYRSFFSLIPDRRDSNGDSKAKDKNEDANEKKIVCQIFDRILLCPDISAANRRGTRRANAN
jgi:hypothetical protein